MSGAGSISMMGEVGRAARAAGGHTVGVIPDALVAMEVADHDSDEFIVTRDMRQRKGIMDERSDAFLALPGGIGTLEELVEVWTARSLNMHHKPVVVLDPWGDYDHLHALLDHWVEPRLREAGVGGPRPLGDGHRGGARRDRWGVGHPPARAGGPGHGGAG